MKENNRIDLSLEMYEDLKDTLIKTIRSAKAGGMGGNMDDAQTKRIERLIEVTELSQEQVTRLLEQLRKQMTLPGVKTEQEREFTDRYNELLAQLAGKLGMINHENRHTHTLIEQVRQAVEAAAKPENLPVQELRHTYTLDLKSSKTFLTMFVMLGCIILQGAFIYRISENNRLLAVNDLKYRYVKMRGEIKEKELTELEAVFRDEQHEAIRDTVRNQVERYETRVRIRAEQLEQATIKERKAQKLLDDVKKLREE